jgi:CheY-like chemotaxis protein
MAVESGPAEPSGRTVLAVDDEPDLLEAIRRVLTRRGHTVLCASGPAEAMQVCRTHDGHIDLLLTDLRMPGGSGTELAAQAAQARPELTVLFMSGLAGSAGVAGSEGPGDVPIVGKPFTPRSLAEAVDQALSARAKP